MALIRAMRSTLRPLVSRSVLSGAQVRRQLRRVDRAAAKHPCRQPVEFLGGRLGEPAVSAFLPHISDAEGVAPFAQIVHRETRCGPLADGLVARLAFRARQSLNTAA